VEMARYASMTGGSAVDSGCIAPQEIIGGGGDFTAGIVGRMIARAGVPLRRITSICGTVALTLMLGGCALLPGGGPAPLDTFELTAPKAVSARRSRVQILIAEPSALKALDGENIVIKPSPGVIQFLKGAQWADRLPKIVQARIAETYQSSGGFSGVGRPGEGLAIDYQIVAEIRAFEVRVDGSARADVEIFVRLLNDRNGVVRASKVFQASAPVSGAGNDAYVAALDAAFGSVAAEMVTWTDSQI
jgi:cholesterol transport system auxiliary component